uniref:Large ribosomal subunit protein mL43 n=1 Tax=Poecilia latipinna TaxID=48699 RepID=A0A3B3TS08_9TELE
MTSRGTPSRFLKSVLQNGVGRYFPQKFSRDFIEEGVVDFAKKNPGTVVYVSPQLCSIPKVVAEYLNGNTKEELLSNKTSQQVLEVLTKLTDQSGQDIIRIRKPYHTDSPSIQGQWHPFTHRPPSVGLIRPQNHRVE